MLQDSTVRADGTQPTQVENSPYDEPSFAETLLYAVDVPSVQRALLTHVAQRYQLTSGLIGLVQAQSGVLTDWVQLAATEFVNPMRVQVDAGMVQAVMQQAYWSGPTEHVSQHQRLQQTIGRPFAHVVPLVMQGRVLGVLVVGSHAAELPWASADAQLTSACRQAAVAISALYHKIAQASQAAVSEERLRIARDMHDTVSQSLFGLAFGLDGCRKLLPDNPQQALEELTHLLETTETVRRDVREIIFDLWPNELTAERFSNDLYRYMMELAQVPLELELDIRGDFAPLSPLARRSLYRICQESLANVAHHADADHAKICLDVVDGRASLLIRDNGKGFVPTAVAQRPNHFGIHGMAERTRELGGSFDIYSRPAEGTSIVVDIPVGG